MSCHPRVFPHSTCGCSRKAKLSAEKEKGGTQEESNIRLSAGFAAANRLHTCELGAKISHIRAVAVHRCKLLHKVQGSA